MKYIETTIACNSCHDTCVIISEPMSEIDVQFYDVTKEQGYKLFKFYHYERGSHERQIRNYNSLDERC